MLIAILVRLSDVGLGIELGRINDGNRCGIMIISLGGLVLRGIQTVFISGEKMVEIILCSQVHGLGFLGTSDDGAINDLACVFSENLVRHFMSDRLLDPHKATDAFVRDWKLGFVIRIVNPLVEDEIKEVADIRCPPR